jgi:23S rRNA (cytosine1962-C5)-methyltransferase
VTERPRVFLHAGRDRRIEKGHPWAYSNEIRLDATTKAIPPGTLAALHRVDGKPLGVGSYNPNTLIALRLFSRDVHASIDEEFLAGRIGRALALRERLYREPFYRLAHAEADGLPGLVCDRFEDILVLQVNTAGMEMLTPVLLAAFDRALSPRAIVLRNDSPMRLLEGIALEVKVPKGAIADVVGVRENGLKFLADVIGGQKTGWFYDQRDSRAYVAPLAKHGGFLDVYCHSGAFAIAAAAAGARRVLGIDSSATALNVAQRAAVANGVASLCEFRQAEAFAELERLGRAVDRYRAVVADPPAFVKSRKELGSGLRGYRKLARLAAPLVEAGGFLFIASCSHHVGADALRGEIVRGVTAAGRSGRIVREAKTGADHPVHTHLPETAYLKSVLLQLD